MRIMTRRSYRFEQRGDTIVEVLIALTIIGLIIGVFSVLSNKSTANLQQVQEGGVAQRIARGQLEYLKAYVRTQADKDIATIPGLDQPGFCMVPPGATNGSGQVTLERDNTVCTQSQVEGGAAYKSAISVTQVAGKPGVFDVNVKVSWEGISVKVGNVDVRYRIYNVTGAGISIPEGQTCNAGYHHLNGTTGQCVPDDPSVKVYTRFIAPDRDASGGVVQPSCSKTTYSPLSNISIQLSENGKPPKTLQTAPELGGSSALAEFTALKNGGTYTVKQGSIPSNYRSCDASDTVGPFSVTSGPAKIVTFTAYPLYPKPATVNQGSYDFPGWHLAAPAYLAHKSQTFTFTNPSPSLALNGVSVTAGGDFVVTASTCSGNLAAGSSCNATVEFRPASGNENANYLGNAGMRYGTLTLNNSNGVSQTKVALKGRTYSNMMRPNDVVNSTQEWRFVSYKGDCYNNVESCGVLNKIFFHLNGNLDITKGPGGGGYCAYGGGSGANVADGQVNLYMDTNGNLSFYGVDNALRWQAIANQSGTWAKLSADLGYVYLKQGYDGAVVNKINGNNWGCPTYFDFPWE